jgi:fructose-bisphosphate aldolase class II
MASEMMASGILSSAPARVRGPLIGWRPLRSVLLHAEEQHAAVGHFNAAELVALKGIMSAALAVVTPVIVGASERERRFAGVRQIAALVRSLREEHDHPVFLNADHTHTLKSAIEAADAGFDAIGFDASFLPFSENVRLTRQAVEAIRSIDPEIVVEGEIGRIGIGSRIHAVEPEEAHILTTPEEARRFVAETGVDLLAPAVGTMHGLTPQMVAGQTRKRLHVAEIQAIREAAGIPLVLHGGSGTRDEDIQDAIHAGVTIVHVNTEIRLALRDGLREGLTKPGSADGGPVEPYSILAPAVEAVSRVVRGKLQLFNGACMWCT